MSDHLSSVEHIDETMHDCITNCSDCHDICMATVQHCLQIGGDHAGPELIRTLLDCTQTCDISRDLMLRASPLHQLYCRGCAHACGSCASACESFPDDPVLRECAEACRRCTESCREMGGASLTDDGRGRPTPDPISRNVSYFRQWNRGRRRLLRPTTQTDERQDASAARSRGGHVAELRSEHTVRRTSEGVRTSPDPQAPTMTRACGRLLESAAPPRSSPPEQRRARRRG